AYDRPSDGDPHQGAPHAGGHEQTQTGTAGEGSASDPSCRHAGIDQGIGCCSPGFAELGQGLTQVVVELPLLGRRKISEVRRCLSHSLGILGPILLGHVAGTVPRPVNNASTNTFSAPGYFIACSIEVIARVATSPGTMKCIAAGLSRHFIQNTYRQI